jgi:hypothetical protein
MVAFRNFANAPKNEANLDLLVLAIQDVLEYADYSHMLCDDVQNSRNLPALCEKPNCTHVAIFCYLKSPYLFFYQYVFHLMC